MPSTTAPTPMSWRQLTTDGYRKGTSAFCGGPRSPPCPQNVTSLAECQALCLASVQPSVCMGLTWLREAQTPPRTRCSLYTAVDLTGPVQNFSSCQMWLVVGRRVKTQVDYAGGSDKNEQSVAPGRETHATTSVSVNMKATSPYGGAVALSIDWADAGVSTIVAKLRIRMPSWLNNSVGVAVDGTLHGHGQPGSYYVIDRSWQRGEVVSFTLPKVYRLSQYTGIEQVKGYEGKRFALQVGPIVLACVGPMDVGYTTVLPIAAQDVEEWLVPTNEPLHFEIKGANAFQFKPLWDVLQGENFTVFPIFGHMGGEVFV